ncbi:MAG TPA: hypothetical protein VNF69_12660 [Burkholderiales bacterium]|nr:hypothetical protein [Burkholderiales bacterium]
MIPRGRPAGRGEQRGVALLILMLVVVLGVSWMLVSAMSSWLNPAATNPGINGKVLGEAKAALLGYVALDAMSDNNPGSLPCPEPGAYVGTANEGIAAGNCTLPAVGRLPWRTLGLDKLVDASGQPLWYVVSPAWALASTTAAPLTINFSGQGQLTVDGQAKAAVALIIAPGAPLAVQASANCTARTQTRNTTPPDYRDYLECQNATYPANATAPGFATSGPTGSFNDQVLKVTSADVMRVLEGPIAERIQRDIVPLIASAAQAMPGGSASVPKFPLAAAWGNPTTASYTGVASTYGGLLPIARSRKTCLITDPGCDTTLLSEPCVPGTDAQCDLSSGVRWAIGSGTPATSVNWNNTSATATWTDGSQVIIANASDYTGNGRIGWIDCSTSQPGTSGSIVCTVWYGNPSCWSCTVSPRFTINGTAKQLGLLFRQLNPTYLSNANSGATFDQSSGASNTVGYPDSSGNASVTTEWQLPSASGCWWWWACSNVTINIPTLYITDNIGFQSQMRDVANSAWFLNNNWQQWTYYTASQRYAPGGAGNCSGTSPACLTVNIDGVPNTNKQALLVFSGRALVGKTQPSSQITDYFEGQNATSANATPTGSVFEKRSDVTSEFNDRVLVISP